MKRIVFAAFATLILAGSTHAAEISCNGLYKQSFERRDYYPSGRKPIANATCFRGLLNGPIVKGDYEKVVAFLRANHPFVSDFSLLSPGGDVSEAIKIGRLFRKYLITTSAPTDRHSDFANGKAITIYDNAPHLDIPLSGELCRGQNCVCASACALIWFGGVIRSGMVGLHRPRTDDPNFKGLSPVEASTMYRRILDMVAAYLNEMEVPKSTIESMISTGSSDIRWVHAVYDVDDPPSIAEWIEASCGWRRQLEVIARAKGIPITEVPDKLTPQERDKLLLCGPILLANHMDRLAPP